MHGSRILHEKLSKLCPGKHEHEITQGATKMKLPDGTWKSIDKTRFAGWYTKRFCDAVVEALTEEFMHRDHGRKKSKPSPTLPVIYKSIDPFDHDTDTFRDFCPHCGKAFRSKNGFNDHVKRCKTKKPRLGEIVAKEENTPAAMEETIGSTPISDMGLGEQENTPSSSSRAVPSEARLIPSDSVMT